MVVYTSILLSVYLIEYHNDVPLFQDIVLEIDIRKERAQGYNKQKV